MSLHRQRALVLMEQGRAELAEPELRRALAEDPHDPYLHALLGLCLARLERKDPALAEAREAVGLAPDFGFAHYALARVLLMQDRPDEALRALEPALADDPEDPDYHAAAASAHLARRRWAQALEAAEEGLGWDPDHVDCTNLRATALVQLGRRDEAAAALGEALARDPEDAFTHANQGWALLHRGQPRPAAEHFRESLRLNPTNEWARAGLVEAMKARNPVYAALLRYFLWMSRLSPRTQWMVVIGGVVGYNVLSDVVEGVPSLRWLLVPLMVGYLGFVLLSWTAEQLFNLVLFLDPLGRHALSRDQRVFSALLGGCVLAALACAAWGAAGGGTQAWLGTGLFAGLMIPVAGTSRAAGKSRVVMGGVASVLFLLVLFAVSGYPSDAADTAGGIAIFGIIASSWIGNFIAARQ